MNIFFKMNITKTFFIRPLIDSYVNFPLNGEQPIKGALGGYELLTYDEFMTWWNDYPDIPNTRGRDERIEEIERYFGDIFKNKCTNVGKGYIKNDITSLKSNPNFDALFAVNKKDTIIRSGNLTIEQYQKLKSESVGGFIIVQKGRCKRLPGSVSLWNDVYSVSLICTNNEKGQLLLGAYLFILKTTPRAQVAILELAGGYTNIPGFISYSKLGFEKDLGLYGDGCFMSLRNLPMSKYLKDETPENIIQIVTKDVELVIPKENRNILNFYKSNKNNPEKQEKLGILLNILYRMELHSIEILTLLINVYKKRNPGDNVAIYYKMQDFFGEKETNNLIDVCYNRTTIQFHDKFVKEDDYEKCDNVDYRECNILFSAYPKIIERIFDYYKNKINEMLGTIANSKRILDDIDCDEEPNNKNCKTGKGGKKLKTNKKHRHYNKKTSRNKKNKPKYKSKKLVKTRKNQKKPEK